jgi:hypothetical protein
MRTTGTTSVRWIGVRGSSYNGDIAVDTISFNAFTSSPTATPTFFPTASPTALPTDTPTVVLDASSSNNGDGFADNEMNIVWVIVAVVVR